MNDLNWFAVQAKPHQESLAAAHVAKLDLEVFLPRIKQEQMICGFARLVTKPLFPGYFFARFRPVLSLQVVRHAPRVLRVVGTLHCPIPLEDEAIQSIQSRVQDDGFIRLHRKRFLPGEQVIIEQGSLAGWMGKVQREWDGGKRVLILLEAIYQARVTVDERWLTSAVDVI